MTYPDREGSSVNKCVLFILAIQPSSTHYRHLLSTTAGKVCSSYPYFWLRKLTFVLVLLSLFFPK